MHSRQCVNIFLYRLVPYIAAAAVNRQEQKMQLEDFRGPWAFPRSPLLQSPYKEFTPNHAKFTLAFTCKKP